MRVTTLKQGEHTYIFDMRDITKIHYKDDKCSHYGILDGRKEERRWLTLFHIHDEIWTKIEDCAITYDGDIHLISFTINVTHMKGWTKYEFYDEWDLSKLKKGKGGYMDYDGIKKTEWSIKNDQEKRFKLIFR